MKNIYLIQPNVFYGDSVYLPYAIGALAAYAWQDEDIRNCYELKKLFYLREKIDDAIESIENPFLVGFSCYIWNYEYNREFAKRLKQKFPDCKILFGGHNVPSGSPALLDELPYIDFLIHDEGEVPFRKLLLSLIGKESLGDVPNLSYRDKNGNAVKNPNVSFDVADFPSPYACGLFDGMVENDGVKFCGMIETNRGCPFGCLFCDWGVYKAKLRQFPEERVLNDISWLSAHKIEFCTCIDANFGILKRDKKFADILVKFNKETGFPSKIQFCYTKGREDVVFDLNSQMNEYGLSKGATLSMQTLSETALENIGRKNLTFDQFSAVLKKYNEACIPTYSELILGMPGETYESFTEGLNKLLIAGQHNSIIVFNCELLMNSKMGQPDIIEKYKIKSVATPYKQHHCAPINDEVVEISHIVTSTYSMSETDWIRSNLFVACLGCFHNLGLLQCFAMYAYSESGIKYSDFYSKLLDWIFDNPDTLCFEVFSDIKSRLEKIVAGNGIWNYVNPVFGNITWPYEEGAFLNIVYGIDRFYREISAFLSDLPIDKSVFGDLMTYQMNAVKLPKRNSFSFEQQYDMNRYFNGLLVNSPVVLEKKRNVISLENAEIPENWEDYAREMVWYGKRGGRIINISEFSEKYI